MNITNFTKKELAAYEEYKAFRSGRWSVKRTLEETLGAALLVAAFIVCMWL